MRALDFKENPHEVKKFPIVLILDQVKNPRNVGMLFRLAEAFGAQHIYFCNDSIHPPNRKIQKAARSTIHRVGYSVEQNISLVLSKLKSENYLLLGLEITDKSQPVRDFTPPKGQSIALVIGSERFGVCPEALDMLDSSCHIPLYGKNLSINVSTAAAIALYELTGNMG